MISYSDDGARRILNFPAIVPCESISLSTLLPSLISIGIGISGFKSKTHFTNKRNFRNSIRLVEALVVFLQEIHVVDSRFGGSLILCLSELHVIFQKLRFLLEDCTREDTRLWMLMKSEDVSTHIRFLMRGISAVLDVIPFSGLDVDDEAKEVVGFIRNQTMEIDFDVEEEDERIRCKVISILDKFEEGISPKSSDLKRVFRYLGIRSWIDCHLQFKFLHSESGEVSSSSDKRGFRFLRSLMALMIYSRCTLFAAVDKLFAAVDNVGNSVSQQSDESITLTLRMISTLNPDDFRCPISLEIMADPVVLSSGHTYERSSILQWFEAGNFTCPKTGKMLPDLKLVQNQALKRLIKLCCLNNHLVFREPGQRRETSNSIIGENSLAAENAIQLVSSFLVSRLAAGTMEDQVNAAREIHLLTKTSIFNRTCLVEAGAVPPLLSLVCSPFPEMQQYAISCIRNLSKYSKTKTIMVEYGGLEIIVKALNEGSTMKVRQLAACALFYHANVEDNRRIIASIPSAIPGILNLLQDGPDRAKKRTLVMIFTLLLHPENHQKMLRAGLVPLVIHTLKSSRKEDLTADCLAVLANLGEKPDGASAIFEYGALPLILRIFGTSNSKAGREYCVSLLLSLSINNEGDVVPVLVENPSSLVTSLYSVVADGSPWARKKASSLIGMLHSYGEDGSTANRLPREHVFRVW